jgi:hypothetical protein
MNIRPIQRTVARAAPALLIAAAGSLATAAESLTFTEGVHVVPAGAYDTIDVLGTAAVHIGSGVQANRMNIASADASAHYSGGKVLTTITNYGAMTVSGGELKGSVFALGSAVIDITGGGVATNGNLTGRNQSVINYSGGTLGSADTVLSDQAVFNWSGGAMSTYFDLIGQSTWNIFGTAFKLGSATYQAGDTVTRANAGGLFTVGSNYDLATLVVTLGDGSTDTVLVLASNGGNAVVPKWTGAIHFAAAPVPEPPTLALLPAGLAVLAWLSRRRLGAGLARQPL